jgi:RNAse (barnase) inhibitor barstar
MREIALDCTAWKTRDDFYNDFFAAIGAPSWHGRNFDALNDSICTGQINQIELPYEIVISNATKATEEALQIVRDFIDFINQCTERGCDVRIRIDQ